MQNIPCLEITSNKKKKKFPVKSKLNELFIIFAPIKLHVMLNNDKTKKPKNLDPN